MRFDITGYWYRKKLHPVLWLLLPLSWLFGLCVALRRGLYRHRIFKSYRFNAPVIVVGNITVGGTGKTPFVIALTALLKSQGYRPGIVTRGVGGKKYRLPHCVSAQDDPAYIGDEARLLHNNTSCPVVVCIDRVAAVRKLLQTNHCNIIISDDGLQHYRLDRDLEIVIIDGERGLGNNQFLPAGPLRESATRLNQVFAVVTNGGYDADGYTMTLEPMQIKQVLDSTVSIPVADFVQCRVHAVAGIGNPERFFTSLRKAGFDIIPHVFPDHYAYRAQDLWFNDNLPVLMTEKDAVKCTAFAEKNDWYLTVTAKLDVNLEKSLLFKLNTLGVDDAYENDFSKNSCRRANTDECNKLCE